MTWTVDSIPRLDNRIALITGANSGLGFETAQVLIKKGATVILGCRSLSNAQIARDKLLNQVDSANIQVLGIDLADLKNVDMAVDQMKNMCNRLDLLFNNAGVMAPPRTLSKQGFELQFAVNHLSHMALTLKLLPLIAKNPGGRVVTVSSGAQYMGEINWNDLNGEKCYARWASYSQSKLANVMFAYELNERLNRVNVDVVSLSAHPGLARTNLHSTSVKANASWQEAFAFKLMDPIFQSAFMGSLSQLQAATDPSAKGGQQYGPRFSFRGSPSLCRVAPSALNREHRENLWKISKLMIEDWVDISQGAQLLSQNASTID